MLCVVSAPSTFPPQGEALFNRLLDKAAELRGQMPSATAINLQAALEGLWQRAKAGLSTDMQQQQQPNYAGGQDREQAASEAKVQAQLGQSGRGGAQGRGRQQRRRERLADKLSHEEGVNLLMQWQMANNEFANAQHLRLLSMRHWDLVSASGNTRGLASTARVYHAQLCLGASRQHGALLG